MMGSADYRTVGRTWIICVGIVCFTIFALVKF